MGFSTHRHIFRARAPNSLCFSVHSPLLRQQVFFYFHIGTTCASVYSVTHTFVHKFTHCKGFCDLLKAHSLCKLDFMKILVCTTLRFPLHMKGWSKHRHLGGVKIHSYPIFSFILPHAWLSLIKVKLESFYIRYITTFTGNKN
jgi:hypothetical protein